MTYTRSKLINCCLQPTVAADSDTKLKFTCTHETLDSATHLKFKCSKWIFCLIAVCLGVPHLGFGLEVIHRGETALYRCVYELEFQAEDDFTNPYFDVRLQVQFTRPDQSQVIVDGFYDGVNLFKARAYCDTLGKWSYRTQSNLESLNNKKGSFAVLPSKLPGKLRIHPASSLTITAGGFCTSATRATALW